MSDESRRHASACHAVLLLPNHAAEVAFEKMEMEARKVVMALDPMTATEAEMRCALAAWKQTRAIPKDMRSFVNGVDKIIAAEVAAQKNLDKPPPSGTIASNIT